MKKTIIILSIFTLIGFTIVNARNNWNEKVETKGNIIEYSYLPAGFQHPCFYGITTGVNRRIEIKTKKGCVGTD